MVYAAPDGRQIRTLALDPYSQKLYWLDASNEGGSLFWADSDGGSGSLFLLTWASGAGPGGATVAELCSTSVTGFGAGAHRNWTAANWETLVWYSAGQRVYTGVQQPVTRPVFPWAVLINVPAVQPGVGLTAGHSPPATCTTPGRQRAERHAGTGHRGRCWHVNRGPAAAPPVRPWAPDGDYYKVTVPSGRQPQRDPEPRRPTTTSALQPRDFGSGRQL